VGPWFAAIWLFFLAGPLIDGWRDRTHLAGIVGIVATIAFAVVYMTIWIDARASRMRLIEQPPLAAALGYLACLTVLGAVMVVAVGQSGLAAAVYVAVACVMTLPLVIAAPAVVVIAVLAASTGAIPGWNNQLGIAFGVMAAALAVLGMRTVMARNLSLLRAHSENTRLAVDNERNRFARDLHDILGHSLTVITVKAELAQRLLDTDPERARAEVADLERLSRDALADVRRAVEGYRELTLPGELARARIALTAAQIEPVVPQAADAVPTELRELFAWTVREGVTNVIRHSRAGRCEIVLSPTCAEVRDDGTGPSGGAEGSGLVGLRERAAGAGAVVVTRSLEPGFLLQVERS